MAYVYRHIRLDKNEPFYIGIGKDKFYSRAYRKTNRNKYWSNVVNGAPYEVEIIIDDVDYEYAKTKEREFILLYGRKDLGTGSLVNFTSGGEGVSGWSEERRIKFIKSRTGKTVSDETRKKLSDSHKGYKPTKETIEKLKIAQRGKIITKETREKMAAKLRGRPQPKWQREILSRAAIGKKVTWSYIPIYQVDANGNTIKEFESITSASKELKLHTSSIGKVLNAKRTHTCGFYFKYKTT